MIGHLSEVFLGFFNIIYRVFFKVDFYQSSIKSQTGSECSINGGCSDMTGPLPLVLCSCWYVSIFARVSPDNVFYVLSTDGMSCIVTIVEPLLVLKCSPLLRSTFARSTRGMRYPFSEDALVCTKLPETELVPTLLMARFVFVVFVVVEDTFFRGLLEPTASIRFV